MVVRRDEPPIQRLQVAGDTMPAAAAADVYTARSAKLARPGGVAQQLSDRSRECFGIGGWHDETGEAVPADLTTALFADEILAQRLLGASPQTPIVYDLRSSRVVAETIKARGAHCRLIRRSAWLK